MEKRENAGNQHFSLFPIVFSILSKREIIILAQFNLSSANAFNLVTSTILSSGKVFRYLVNRLFQNLLNRLISVCPV